jgi:hypothetical protein
LGFNRRYAYVPDLATLGAIEGIVIIDVPPPGSISGIGVGVVGIVGEFADMRYAVAVDANGNVTTKPQPIEIFGTQDMLNKVGGFDELLGDFGGAGGNGFVTVRNKTFKRLVLVPVNLCSAKGVRAWRQLPTNKSATDATPIVPMQAASVAAGREFKNGANRARLGTRVDFKGNNAYASGVDGSVVAVAAAAAVIESAAGPWDLRGGAAAAPQLRIAFNIGGDQDVTLTANPAVVLGAGGAFAAMAAETMKVQVGTGPLQTVTFGTEGTIALAITLMNNQLFDCHAEAVDANNVKIVSDQKGTGARVRTSSVAVGITTKLGIANNADQSGTGDVANLGSVTSTEWATKLAGITNGAATADGAKLKLTSTTTGLTGSAWVKAASTAAVIMGGDFGAPAATFGTGTGAATSNAFTAASGAFVASGVAVGDALVLGVIGGAAALGANAGTYRVKSIDGATQITVEKQDGSAFSFTTGAALPWRLHIAAVADTGGNKYFSQAGGYVVPARVLDASIAASSALTPSTVPDAATSGSWDPLSGLAGYTDPATGLVYTAGVQAPNVTGTGLDVLYATAIDTLLSNSSPAADVNLVLSARVNSAIRSKLKAHVLTASSQGVGRRAIVAPELTTYDLTTSGGAAAPGVGANRNERVLYAWPGGQTSIPEAAGFIIKTADGNTTTDGVLDVTMDAFLASIVSSLPSERNPAQGSEPVPTIMAPVLELPARPHDDAGHQRVRVHAPERHRRARLRQDERAAVSERRDDVAHRRAEEHQPPVRRRRDRTTRSPPPSPPSRRSR